MGEGGASHDARPARDGAGDRQGPDGGATADAGRRSSDAGQDALGEAGSADGGIRCNPDAVRFAYLARGPLQVGTLCDDLFVCVRSAEEASRIMSLSPRFFCRDDLESWCPEIECRYLQNGDNRLDADEFAEICAVTLLTPTPHIACVVYGP